VSSPLTAAINVSFFLTLLSKHEYVFATCEYPKNYRYPKAPTSDFLSAPDLHVVPTKNL
jgi:hypothetical protein